MLQTTNNELRSDLFEKTKVQIDGDGLQNQNEYLIKANEELKHHLEEVCAQLEGSLTENERITENLKSSGSNDLLAKNEALNAVSPT